MSKPILILAGTYHARQYANALHKKGRYVIASLKGGTNAKNYSCPTRVGGFGGAQKMAEYLLANNVEKVIDKTHRFAEKVSQNAKAACVTANVPYEYAKLAPWQKKNEGDWQSFKSYEALIGSLKTIQKRRIFLSIGAKHATQFRELSNYHELFIRSVIPIKYPEFTNFVAKGPFTLTDEIQLFKRNKIELLVCRNSGEIRSYTKIEAAIELNIPIYMLEYSPPSE